MAGQGLQHTLVPVHHSKTGQSGQTPGTWTGEQHSKRHWC